MKRQVNEEKTITQNFYFLKIRNIREGEQKKVIMDDNDTLIMMNDANHFWRHRMNAST